MKTIKFLFFRYSPANGLCAIAEIDGRTASMLTNIEGQIEQDAGGAPCVKTLQGYSERYDFDTIETARLCIEIWNGCDELPGSWLKHARTERIEQVIFKK